MQSNQYINEESLQKFSTIIANKISNGFVITERNDALPFAVLSKDAKAVDHGFNFLLCCVTLGLWSIAWIYLTYVSSREKKILVAIDEDGNTFEEKCYSE
ncbi:hypothetical protein ACM55M_11785 [Flavobacterium sp. ZT3R25]|uniref:hypothetical protein n=1 Tax=Flavobacterium galactosi TaxID=3398735 RepID=UPI003A8BA95C